MESITPGTTAPQPAAARPTRSTSDLVYPVVTVAAMLWLLASLWAF